jgi:hypothetical protein
MGREILSALSSKFRGAFYTPRGSVTICVDEKNKPSSTFNLPPKELEAGGKGLIR